MNEGCKKQGVGTGCIGSSSPLLVQHTHRSKKKKWWSPKYLGWDGAGGVLGVEVRYIYQIRRNVQLVLVHKQKIPK